MIRAIDRCRVCGNTNLPTVLDLGSQCLTGVFPRKRDEVVPSAPLELVKCLGDARAACGLVQLRHSYSPSEMYGDNYGYRSSLNRSMVEHLRAKAAALRERVTLAPGDVVLDIGSNDGTSLSFYPSSLRRIGIDPTSAKFARYYPEGVTRVADFFSARTFFAASGGQKASLVTSLAMFYDLEAPLDFAREIAEVLVDGGTWHFEQSYLPRMLETNSYDTICHEHLEYYALRQIAWIAERSGFRVADVTLNDVNGGSFAVTAVKDGSPAAGHAPAVATMLASEAAAGLDTLAPYQAFAARALKNRDDLRALVRRLRAEGKRVFGLGASTKGNVTLQYCGFTEADLGCIAEVNEDKFGSFTPGTKIPICSEREAYAGKPDYLLVLPWHFRAGLVRGAAGFLKQGGKLIFPLPQIEIVG
ncbi:MAG TPA: class I SAM-dependent methyltransferase [Polyangiaceae bacterium]|nr:class I SAM-dependent methyltransferase [Polyangiaceae bacterium]